MFIDMEQISESFRALGDPTRLRILRLIGSAALNVSELVSLVGVAQSSVSHHLAKLKGLELIREDRQNGFTYYSLALGPQDPRWPLIRVAQEADDDHGDRSRLEDLLSRREDPQTLNERLLEPGQSALMWSRALATLLPPLDVADFGCGTGQLTVEMARWARKVTAIDKNPLSLDRARQRLAREELSNVTFLEADLEDLPLPDAKKGAVFLSQSLHFVNDPEAVLREAARILEPSGRVAVLELMPHREDWVKDRLGHVHLGFEPEQLIVALRQAGFTKVQVSPFGRDGTSAFKVFLLTGVRK
jgi:ubiquinone/menaquinone biosynthesis C-methylase UbiE/DNA-binding transcriptional ArsR family regulator